VNGLKEFRKSTGLSQENIARKMGVSLSMYEKVERGNASVSRGFMQKLKKTFPSVSIDAMFFGSAERSDL